MLAIGRALLTNPRLLVLDEATEGLAPLIRREIWRCLGELKSLGQSILVVDKNVAALTDLAAFRAEMDALIDEIHASRRAPGVERILSAGELEYETAVRYRADGIPLNDQTLAELAGTARALGIALPELSAG